MIHTSDKVLQASLFLWGITLVTVVTAEYIFDHAFGGMSGWMPWIFSIGFIALALFLFRKALFQNMGKTRFILAGVMGFGLLTVIGLILSVSGASQESEFAFGNAVMRFFHLDHLLNSWVYKAFLILIGAGLLRQIYLKPFDRDHRYVQLTMIAACLMILSVFVNDVFGWRGTMILSQSDNQDQVNIYHALTGIETEPHQLPFSVRLNEAERVQSKADYQIAVVESGGIANPHAPVEPASEKATPQAEQKDYLATFPLKQDKIFQILTTDLYYRLNAFYPDFGFIYDYPVETDTIEPLDPGIMLQLIIGTNRPQLQLRTNENSSITEPHLGATLAFSWNLPDSLSNRPEMTPQELSDKPLKLILFVGDTNEVIYVYDEGLVRSALIRGKDYDIPGKASLGFHHQFVFPDAKHIKASPGSLSEKFTNPVAKLEVWGSDWERSELAYVYPARRGASGQYRLRQTDFKLELVQKPVNRYTRMRADVVIRNPATGEEHVRSFTHVGTLLNAWNWFSVSANPEVPTGLPIGNIRFLPGMPAFYLGALGLLIGGLGLLFRSAGLQGSNQQDQPRSTD